MALVHGLFLVVVVVAEAQARTEEGCISRDAVQTSTFHDEMDVSFCRRYRDVKLKVMHSKGECTCTFTKKYAPNNKWTAAKLNLNNITISVNGTKNIPLVGSCAVSPNTIKKVSIEGAAYILSNCSQGPAIYQISKDEKDLVIPWYEDQVHLVLKPLVDTQIKIKTGDEEFVICFNGTHTAAQRNSSTCSGGAKTSDIYITIPKSKDIIKVNTLDDETDIPIIISGENEPLTISKDLINGTVIVRQCIPECRTSQGEDFPEDCSCSCIACLVSLGIIVLVLLALLVWIGYRRNEGVQPSEIALPLDHPST